MRMDEMECVCGEILRAEQSDKGEKELGGLMKLFREHMAREDHKPKAEQWVEAYQRIEAGRERSKSQQQR